MILEWLHLKHAYSHSYHINVYDYNLNNGSTTELYRLAYNLFIPWSSVDGPRSPEK